MSRPPRASSTRSRTRATAQMVEALARNTAEHGIRDIRPGRPEPGHRPCDRAGDRACRSPACCWSAATATPRPMARSARWPSASAAPRSRMCWRPRRCGSASRRPCASRVDGTLGRGVTAKDVILAIIAQIGAAGATGHVIEYAGSAIRGLSMEGRLTLCNMSIEAGGRAGMVAPDETTFAYLHGRPYAPKGAEWDAGGGALARRCRATPAPSSTARWRSTAPPSSPWSPGAPARRTRCRSAAACPTRRRPRRRASGQMRRACSTTWA